MARRRATPKQSRKSKADALFIRADGLEACGDLKAAFRLFLAAAKAGDSGCQLNLGNYYDDEKVFGVTVPRLCIGISAHIGVETLLPLIT